MEYKEVFGQWNTSQAGSVTSSIAGVHTMTSPSSNRLTARAKSLSAKTGTMGTPSTCLTGEASRVRMTGRTGALILAFFL